MFSGGALERMSFGSGYHAVHLCIDYHAVDDDGESTAGATEEGRGEPVVARSASTPVTVPYCLALIQGTLGMTVGLANQGVAFSTDFRFYFVAVSTL